MHFVFNTLFLLCNVFCDMYFVFMFDIYAYTRYPNISTYTSTSTSTQAHQQTDKLAYSLLVIDNSSIFPLLKHCAVFASGRTRSPAWYRLCLLGERRETSAVSCAEWRGRRRWWRRHVLMLILLVYCTCDGCMCEWCMRVIYMCMCLYVLCPFVRMLCMCCINNS